MVCCSCPSVVQGKLLLFATNNSGKSRESYLAKFTQLGFGSLGITAAHIFTSSQTAAAHMRKLDASTFDRSAHKVFTIGEAGIGVELRAAGVQCVEAMQLFGGKHLSKAQLAEIAVDPTIRAVVIGIDEELTYTKIAYGVACLARADCLFISTNQDSTLPTAGHTLPGAGSCVAMIATASGRVPLNMGKPEVGMLELAMAEHNLQRDRVLMVGDRLDTDILFGLKGGVASLFVTDTGINTMSDVAATGIVPTFAVGNVNEILASKSATSD